MPNIALIIFFSLIGIFIILFVYYAFTKKGRINAVRMITSSKDVTMVGQLPPTEINTLGVNTKQELKLYRCINKNEQFYVIENTQKSLGGMSRYYVKITPEIASQLVNLLK